MPTHLRLRLQAYAYAYMPTCLPTYTPKAYPPMPLHTYTPMHTQKHTYTYTYTSHEVSILVDTGHTSSDLYIHMECE